MRDVSKQRLGKPHLWLISLIGVIVPRRLRADWRQEWEAELRYREELLAEWDHLNWKTKLDLLRRSLGAFRDALLLQPKRLEDEMFQDLRYGARMLARSKGLTTVAVLSLALGIGANTAIFSLIDVALLKQMPVAQPDQLYFVDNVGARGGGGSPPYPCFEQFRAQNQSLSGLAAFAYFDPRLNIDGQVEQVKGQWVSGDYFSVLGVKAALGRTFSAADDAIRGQGGKEGPVAVISFNYWTRRFGRNPAVIGKVVQYGVHYVMIIGVTPPDFYGLKPGVEANITFPFMLANPGMFDPGSRLFETVVRLKPGISVEQARAELDAIYQTFTKTAPTPAEELRDYFARVELAPADKGLDTLRSQFSKPLQALMVVVALVLLIACANVANLLLARAATRRKEFAVRQALGASRLRLMRQMLTESLLLVALGGLLGLLVARWGSAFLVSFFATGQSRLTINLPLDNRVLLFTVGLSLLTGLLFGMAPAFQTTRVDPNPALKDNAGAGDGSHSRFRFGKLLIVLQVSLSLLLLIGAGLFLRTLQNLKRLDAGFNPEGVLTMYINPAEAPYPGARLTNLWHEILSRVEALPGVRSASLAQLSPLSGHDQGVAVEVPGFTPQTLRDKQTRLNRVSQGYFTTLGIAVTQGRAFSERDNETAPKVALFNETAARFYFGDRNPIGARIRLANRPETEQYEIIGIVRDSKHNSLRREIPRLIYLPALQSTSRLGRMFLAVRASGAPADLAGAIHNEIRAAGSDILITDVATLSEQVDQSLLQERLVFTLSTAFGLLALLLACIGLYGVMSYDVARRRREIGIRMAVGAQAADVVRMVMRETMLMIGAGVVIGLGAAFAATRLVTSLLFGLTATDPATIALATLLLLTVAALAGYLPAHRAARVDPMTALRRE